MCDLWGEMGLPHEMVKLTAGEILKKTEMSKHKMLAEFGHANKSSIQMSMHACLILIEINTLI